MKRIFLLGSGIAMLAASVAGNLAAGGEVKTVDLTLKVMVDAPPPCTVKGSAVEFGDVVISQIDGTNYRLPAKFTLDCSARQADDLRMQLKATTTTINGEIVLDAGIAGFGIRIENVADNSLFSVGENNWTSFDFNNLPTLNAVPVKQSGAQLMASEFNASMTVVVDYQ
ncbi:fimbrial protein [Escherichia albertii]|uniref:fimbrial protein n=1 Tax=Escherichia albertii TaxID=208962 RepID=UPI0010F621B5|nr:fimbrial protein [Escherichia albertii]MCZ8651343.1 fimbrial protein [Escherichia albertii]WDB32979.1 fimbrial protein [Escherichia albertii]